MTLIEQLVPRRSLDAGQRRRIGCNPACRGLFLARQAGSPLSPSRGA
ncbi:MAG TPA: hypothetical protein VFO83_05860 [Aggregicoccus sp.]|nr:hypothetical protein [Aggregicoccus sp.]